MKKYEKLNNGKGRYFFPLLVVLVIITIFILKTSYSKYLYTKSYPLVSGTINYTPYNYRIMKITVDSSTKYTFGSDTSKDVALGSASTNLSNFGTFNSNYTLDSTNSYCNKPNGESYIRDSSATISYNNSNKNISITGNSTKAQCYIYLKEIKERTSAQMLNVLRGLNSSVPSSSGTRSSFSSVIGSGSYTYTATDDLGISYYFAGAVNTNWVKIGSTYWRIVRINGNGSVRLIYSGTTAPTSRQATVMTGTQTQYTTSAFNSYTHNAYVGYMYGSTTATTYADVHKNTNPSTIKDAVDEWYNSNKSTMEGLIDINVGFCGDRSIDPTSSGTGIGTTATDYGADYRLYDKKSPDITCNKSNSIQYNNDLYTKTGASRGNKALSNPVGLITADEVALAGGINGSSNTGYYLYTNQTYWTMSPNYYSGGNAVVFHVNLNGNLNGSGGSYTYGVRPVINLKSSLTWSGQGTYNSPFQVS